jgi:polygalacturonase
MSAHAFICKALYCHEGDTCKGKIIIFDLISQPHESYHCPVMTIGRPFSICCLILFTITCSARERHSLFNPYDFGAKGDGKNLDTEALQAAIDSCHISGGGSVYLPGGHFRSGTVYLKDNVTLFIEAGATLQASDNLDDFPSTVSKYPSYTKELVTLKAFIYAEDAKNISIAGKGCIDGNGDHWAGGPYGSPSFSKRPRILHFRGCRDISVSNITLYNAASWVQSYQSCYDILINGITVDSRENKDINKERFAEAPGRNTDGLDLVDCEKVRISNCYINSGDDAICLKSLSNDGACRDITISNCVVSSNASGIKIGTETSGRIEDITIQNCVVYDTRIDALSIMTVDGARVERITVSNLNCRNIKGSAIFIRLGNRNRTYREHAVLNTPCLKDIIIENIQGTGISSAYGCIIAGLKDIPAENILVTNVNLTFEGGGKAGDSFRNIPEEEQSYPNGRIFGVLPAYGFFIRHARNITLDEVQLRLTSEDERPALFCEDTGMLTINRLTAGASPHSPQQIRLINTKNAVISQCYPENPVPVFLSVEGKHSNGIVLLNNRLKNAQTSLVLDEGLAVSAVKELGTIRD